MLFLKNIARNVKDLRNIPYSQLIKPAALLIVAVIATFSFFTKASAPTIVSILPSSGSQAGGDIVTITGTDFNSAPSVMFGGTPAASVTLQSETVITAKVPAHSPGKVNVTVINTDGQYGIVVDGYAYNHPPTITSVSPNIGSTQGGDIVMIKGAHFFGTPAIQFGDALASNVTVTSSDSLSAVTPVHDAAMVDITLTNPDGQATTLVAAFMFSDNGITTTDGATPVDLSGGTDTDTTTSTPTTIITSPSTGTSTTEKVTKTYKTTQNNYSTLSNPSPTITAISPSSGNRFGGDSVTITGTNFVATPVVTFGGINAISTIYQSSTTLVVTTPANNTGGTVNVVVTNPDAQSVTSVGGFTYTAGAPTIASITPSTGSTAGGDYVTIMGTNFYGSPTLTIGGSSATNITVRSANKITAYTPAHATGAVSVVLANQDEQSVTAADGFTYASFGNPAPTISSVSPASGTIGTTVTITGTNFLASPTVKINGVSATGVTLVNSTSITATAPSNSAGTYDVTVTNTDGQMATLTNGFTYNAGPVISAITPTTGSTNGGDTITLTGIGFYGSPMLTIGGISATSVVVSSTTKITAITPAHVAGVVDVVLTNQDAQSSTLSNGYTYASFGNPAPTISSVSPTTGTTGTSVSITGANFLASPGVKINGISAGSVTRISSTAITATAPANNPGTYDVTITNTDGQTATLTDGFTYLTYATVITSDATDITPDSATINATITATGGEDPTRYIEWGTSSGSYSTTCDQSTGTGMYSCDLANLTADTTYYFRAKATNSIGTAYGQEKSFTTLPGSVTITDPDSTKLSSANTSGYIKSSGAFSGASNATFNTTVIFKRGSNQVSIPRNTQVTKTAGGTFNMSQFTITDVSTQIKQAVSTSAAAVEIGIANASLTFSSAATLSIAVGASYEGKTLAIQSQSAGQNDWTSEGTCNVTNGLCAFSITHATTYTVNGESSGAGGSADMTAYLKLDRLTASATTGGTVCMSANLESTEASVTVTFPAGFTVNQTSSNWTTTTDNLPSGAVAWLGIATASNVSGQSVTFPSGDLSVGQLSCFNFSSTNTLTNATAGTSKVGSISTRDASGTTINFSEYAVAIISSDLVLLTATVPPILNVELQSGGDTFIGPISTTQVTKTNGKMLTIATNADNGWVAWVKSTNAGLYSTSSSATISTIGSLDNTPTDLSVNPTGYLLGVDVTQDSTVGYGTVSQQNNYGAEYKTSGNLNLGGTLSTIFQPIAASDGTTGGDTLTLIEKAKITSVQAAAMDYTDTLTVIVGGRF